jgi:signal transduction histidine kinase
MGPGLFAATMSFLVIDYFFIVPAGSWSLGPHLLRLLVFGLVAVLTSYLNGKMKKSKTELEELHHELEIANKQLEHRIEMRTEELLISNKKLINEIEERAKAERAILEVSNREQRRLGQDLHDGLSQSLAGVKLMAERVKQTLNRAGSPESDKVATIETRLAEALGYVDNVSRGLYPVELETNGLMAALEELAVKISRVHPVSCKFICPKPIQIYDSAVANNVYRIAQEAVVNGIKGGKASRINIRLSSEGDRARLDIADNGIGIGHGPMRNGMGLKLMEYRARIINGGLRIRAGKKSGTFVRCIFPLEAEAGG